LQVFDAAGKIENVTYHPERRVDVAVGCEYSADIDRTREVLTAAVESVAGRIDGEGRGYQIYLKELGSSSLDWAIRVWFPTADYWAKKEELTRAVKMHLDEAGIGIPFPQMDVHLDGKLGE
ncbi:MAG: mechanosensitive ion channel family protein, partial [Planctomycetota bacterium]